VRWKDLSSSNLCWSSCGIPQKEGAGIQGSWCWDSSAQAWYSLGKGSFRSAVNDIRWMLYRIRYWPRYFMTWPSISNVRKAFDIVNDINIRYRTFYVWYRRDETSISITLFMTFDIEGLWPWISHNDTFYIEHLRYRHTISKVQNVDIVWHSISMSSILNVALDIEGPTLDIGVVRIQMCIKVAACVTCVERIVFISGPNRVKVRIILI
jgi:hypothetical protein